MQRAWTLLEASPGGAEEQSRYRRSEDPPCESGKPCAPADTGVLADFVTSLAGCPHIPGKFKHWKRGAMFSMASISQGRDEMLQQPGGIPSPEYRWFAADGVS